MEELLASIRKAIQDDIGEIPGAGSRPAVPARAGSMREMKVKAADEVSSASAEINGLRDRIQRNRAAEALARDIGDNRAARQTAPAVTRPGPFSSVLSGQADTSWQRPAAPEPRPVARYEPRSRQEPSHFEAPPRPETPLQHPPPLRPSFAEAEAPPSDLHSKPTGYGRFGREVEALQEQPAWREPPPALPAPEPAHPAAEASILSDGASQAASSAFNRLADSFLSRALGERPIEDMAREMLRGLLKQWLDDNLPALVERLVREEIERVARRGR